MSNISGDNDSCCFVLFIMVIITIVKEKATSVGIFHVYKVN